MGISIIGSTIKVYRDENDKYYTYLSGTVFNLETREMEDRCLVKRKIRFYNDLEVLNKTKIYVRDGFLSPQKFKIKEGDDYKIINAEVFYIKEFDVIEEGIEEKQKVKEYKPKSQTKEEKTAEKLNNFAFNQYGNVTPF